MGFPDIFRQAPVQRLSGSPVSPAVTRKDSPLSSYAGALNVSSGGPLSTPVLPPVDTTAAEKSPCTAAVSFNSVGHRIDMPVKYDKQTRDKFMRMEKRLCFDYHLSSCWQSSCKHQHGQTLRPTERETLQCMARMIPCYATNCDEPTCYYGHRCPHDGHCSGKCKFPVAMHKVDMNIAPKVKSRD